jgi:hypothetical protein
VTRLLYLDQNYLSGIAKREPACRELEPVLRGAVARGAPAGPAPQRIPISELSPTRNR